MNIRLKQLRAFRAIMDTGSVSEAAVALGLTQSSVSKLLAGFEQELGFLLFDRIGRRLRLSEQGRLFHQNAGNAIELLEDIQAIAEDIRDKQGTRLRICAVGPIIHSNVLPNAVRAFSERHPDFAFTFEMQKRIDIEDWITQRHSDIGFTLFPVDRTKMSSRELVSVKPVVVVPADHPFAERETLFPEDLKEVDLVMPKGSVRLRGLLEADFVRANINLRPRYETSNAITSAHLVKNGVGITIIDPFTISGNHSANFKLLEWGPDTVLTYGMIWSSFRKLTKFEEEFFFGDAKKFNEICLAREQIEC